MAPPMPTRPSPLLLPAWECRLLAEEGVDEPCGGTNVVPLAIGIPRPLLMDTGVLAPEGVTEEWPPCEEEDPWSMAAPVPLSIVAPCDGKREPPTPDPVWNSLRGTE
mmetsp:Transcript_42137/g.117317  ORF Transcript_42137/g.117317 Transcript_42137/m.117317 type:complete len:107 (+) Transcript_42137:207-527(+)